ncbi:MAG TPA: hypothetical protein VGO59_07680 [Verrucomicrobiae bacterium]|jgi:hypothetical protein
MSPDAPIFTGVGAEWRAAIFNPRAGDPVNNGDGRGQVMLPNAHDLPAVLAEHS